MTMFFDEHKLFFQDLSDDSTGFIEKTDDGYKIAKEKADIPPDKGYLVVIPGEISAIDGTIEDYHGFLIFPENLGMEPTYSPTGAAYTMEKALANAFETAQKMNYNCLYAEIQGLSYLYIPFAPYDELYSVVMDLYPMYNLAPTISTRLLGEDFSIKDKDRLVIEEIDDVYCATYLLANGKQLFSINDVAPEDMTKYGAVYRQVIEAYRHLKDDECMGIDATNPKKPILLGVRLSDNGELVIRELKSFRINELLLDNLKDRPPFFVISKGSNGSLIFRGANPVEQWRDFVKNISDKRDILDAVWDWVEDMESRGVSPDIFSRSRNLKNKVEFLEQENIKSL